jgi:hypothetical protein
LSRQVKPKATTFQCLSSGGPVWLRQKNRQRLLHPAG